MPTYDYYCKNCNITKEILHSIYFIGDIKCDKCDKPMEKQVSTTSLLQFKGAGFHVNDYPADDSGK